VSFASNGVTQTGLPGVALDAKFTGTVFSNSLPSNTPILFQTAIAGEGTHGVGPYGGTYSYSFDPTFPGYFFQFSYSTALNINGVPVIPTDAQTALFNICDPKWVSPNVACNVTGASGSGGILVPARNGSYPTTVGSVLNFEFSFGTQFSYGTPTVGTLSANFDPGPYFSAVDPTTGAPISGLSIVLSDGTVIPINSPPPPSRSYSCKGFQPPFDVALSLTTKTNRAIPLKAQLFDSSNNLVTPTTLGTAPRPVVNVSYSSGTSAAIDDTALLDPLGQSSSGNQFNFDTTANTWWFNLASTPFAASGTYTVTLQSGDATQYQVSPQCSGKFIRK
jgi:hypothetical protein